MKKHPVVKLAIAEPPGWPTADELAALRAWYAGLSARDAVGRYLGQVKASGQSSRSMLSAIRRQLARFAIARHRDDLVELLLHPAQERSQRARTVVHAIDTLRKLPAPQPLITDAIERWLPPRAVNALHRHGIKSLADYSNRLPKFQKAPIGFCCRKTAVWWRHILSADYTKRCGVRARVDPSRIA